MTTTLTVRVESDRNTIPTAEFSRAVMTILNDPAGWPRAGINFELNTDKSDLLIRLSHNTTVNKECGFDMMSCAWMPRRGVQGRSLINYERWMHGAKPSGFSLDAYRRYVVNHEVGHLLGLNDAKCPGAGMVAPVMVQHTIGTGGCTKNNHPTAKEIDRVRALGVVRLRLGGKKKSIKKKSIKKSTK